MHDSRLRRDHPRSVLGFIQLNRGRYEVMTLGDPIRFSSFADLEQARTSFILTDRVTANRPVRDVAVLTPRASRAEAAR